MGFNLADVGLVSSGFDASAEQARLRQAAEEDRLYKLEQRRQQQERDAAAQAEFQRQQAFQNEARQVIPQFLSGGAQALPGQPASSTEIPQPATSDEGDGGGALPPAVKDTPAKPAADNFGGMYDALQKVAVKHGRLADYETMKGHAQKLQEEGVLDFVRAARRGADEEELKDTFNKTGKVRLAELKKVGAEQYVGVTEAGKPVSFDLNQITESMLAPKDYLAHKDKGEVQSVRRELGQAATDAKNTATQARLEAAIEKLKSTGDVNAARAELSRAQAEAARAKAEGGDGQRPRNHGNWNVFDAAVRRAAKDVLTEKDPDTGKDTVDSKNLQALSSRASALARAYPDIYTSAADAVEAATEHIQEVKKIQEDALDQARTEAKTIGSGAGDRWVKDRAAVLTKTRLAAKPDLAAPAAPPPAAAPAPKATPKATPKAAAGVAAPQTQADFDALPKGSRYKNPADGKTYVKN